MIASFTRNTLLAAMPPADRERLGRGAVEVALDKNRDLLQAGQPMSYCWFPIAGMISIIATDRDDGEAEVGIVGHEGFAEIGGMLNDKVSAARLLVQIGGQAIRVDMRTMRAAIAASPALSDFLLAYVRAFTIQTAATALAFAQYQLSQRLARWLLMCADRVGPSSIDLTHESLATMLGVRRAGVTVALQKLAAGGAITARRGRIACVDQPLLLRIAGAGYGDPEAEYKRLLKAASAKHSHEAAKDSVAA